MRSIYDQCWSQHLYSYAGNNPINYVDPTGHFALLATMAIGAGIGALIGTASVFVADVLDGELDATLEDYAGAAAPVAGAAALATAMTGMFIAGTTASVAEQ